MKNFVFIHQSFWESCSNSKNYDEAISFCDCYAVINQWSTRSIADDRLLSMHPQNNAKLPTIMPKKTTGGSRSKSATIDMRFFYIC